VLDRAARAAKRRVALDNLGASAYKSTMAMLRSRAPVIGWLRAIQARRDAAAV
jgi:hypothetical protein